MSPAFDRETVGAFFAEEPPESRVVLRDLAWADFLTLLQAKGDAPSPRFAYLDGTLELLGTGSLHEETKKRLSRMIEQWATLRRVPLVALGSSTMKSGRKRACIEPDECYVLGEEARLPADLAIEVAYSNWHVDRFEIYRRLGVREIWLWRRGQLGVHLLRGAEYIQAPRSEVLPALDLEALLRCAEIVSQPAAIAAWHAHLQSG